MTLYINNGEVNMKTGWKTSEFWVALVAANIAVFNTHLGLNLPGEAVAAVVGVAAAYALSRGVAKLGQS